MTSENVVEAILAHYGTPGMKWGVRQARTGQIGTATKRLDAVASGHGTVIQKVRTVAGSSALRLATSGGLKKEAARQSADLKAQRARLEKGNASLKDIMKAYGHISLADILRSTKD